jgi:hypothetical protein
MCDSPAGGSGRLSLLDLGQITQLTADVVCELLLQGLLCQQEKYSRADSNSVLPVQLRGLKTLFLDSCKIPVERARKVVRTRRRLWMVLNGKQVN